MKLSTITGTAMPTAHIAINKSRMKVYETSTLPTYYLKNGTEFQIELFNPTTKNILAKIKLNGAYITQGGLVLKAGQRIFLERYLDVSKKFLFETYEVEANNSDVTEAVKYNGDLEVEFYNEIEFKPYDGLWYNDYYYNSSIIPINNTNANGGNIFLSNVTTYNPNPYTTNIGATNISSTFNNNNVPLSLFDQKPKTFLGNSVLRSKSISSEKEDTIETGRIEKGSVSKQNIGVVDMDFEIYLFHKVAAKLSPISQLKQPDEIVVKSYCTECGAKQKKGFKFCPVCGTKN